MPEKNATARKSPGDASVPSARPLCERDAAKCLTMCPHACVETCPTSAFSLVNGTFISFDQAKCIGCGKCIDACPGGALSINGRSNPNALQREEESPVQRVSLKKQVLARRKATRK